MRVLADTHVLLWWLSGNAALGAKTKSIIESVENEVYCSALSIAEINLKIRIGKLKIDGDFINELRKQSFNTIMFDIKAAATIAEIPELSWKDPFDLMLIAQAVSLKVPLLTADKNILASNINGLKCIDARK